MYLQRNSIIYDPVPVFALISGGISIIFSLIGRGFDALFYRIPFSERKNISLKEPNNIEKTTSSNDEITNSNDEISDDDIVEIK